MKNSNPRVFMFRFLQEYLKHSALNLGQALHGLRYIASHPDIDGVAPRGSSRHLLLSLRLRSARVGNDLFFALIPPHWHHTPQELEAMTRTRTTRWFQYGYRAWRFTQTGEPRDDLTGVD